MEDLEAAKSRQQITEQEEIFQEYAKRVSQNSCFMLRLLADNSETPTMLSIFLLALLIHC